MNTETWLQVINDPRYEVSNTGRVRRSLDRMILKPFRHHLSGHLYIFKRPHRAVHHLVLGAFRGPKPQGTECRHLDGDPANNRVDNLVWGSRKENVADYRKHNGRHMRSSLSDEIRNEIKKRLTGRRGERPQIAREFGVKVTVIHDLVRRRSPS